MDEPQAPAAVTVEVVAEIPSPPPEPSPPPPAMVDPVAVELGATLQEMRAAMATLPERIGTSVENSVAPLRGDLSALTARVAAVEQVAADDEGDRLAAETDPSQATPVVPDIPPPSPGEPKKARPTGLLGILDRAMFG